MNVNPDRVKRKLNDVMKTYTYTKYKENTHRQCRRRFRVPRLQVCETVFPVEEEGNKMVPLPEIRKENKREDHKPHGQQGTGSHDLGGGKGSLNPRTAGTGKLLLPQPCIQYPEWNMVLCTVQVKVHALPSAQHNPQVEKLRDKETRSIHH